jgi:hypothetical protein
MSLIEWPLEEILRAVPGHRGYLCLRSIQKGFIVCGRIFTHHHLDYRFIARQAGYDSVNTITAGRNHCRFLVVEIDFNPAGVCPEVLSI